MREWRNATYDASEAFVRVYSRLLRSTFRLARVADDKQ
jgi:hypothetical protein